MIALAQLSYLLSITVFIGIPLLVLWRKHVILLRTHRKIILLAGLSSLPLAACEYLALEWGAWFYYPERTLNFSVLTQIETYILALTIMVSGACLTIVCAEKLEKEGQLLHLPTIKSQNRILPWKALQKVFATAAITKR